MLICCENVAPHVTETFFEGAECLTQKWLLANDTFSHNPYGRSLIQALDGRRRQMPACLSK